MNQNESAIEQINLGYNDQEDRLLLKLGLADQSEIAVWITRRICKLMSELLQNSTGQQVTSAEDLVSSPILNSRNQAIASFAREVAEQESKQQMDFKSVYITDREARSAQPLIAMQCVIASAEGQPSQLELHCQNGQIVKMALTSELVQAVLSMVQLSTREAGWDLPQPTNNTQVNVISTQQVLH
ncbi:MAG: hypothetical protein NTW57_02510 [Methylophilales bacterium]|nr:hypothetical protein [Methylophilales bacterium]